MRANLRKLFTTEEVEEAINKFPTSVEGAKYLSELRGVLVVPSTLRYWKRQLTFKRKDGKNYIGTTVADRAIRNEIELRERSPSDDFPLVMDNQDKGNKIIFGDFHSPYNHPDAIDFLIDVKKKYKTKRAYCTGDEVDNHALSFHDSDPSLDSAGPELGKARKVLHKLSEVFPTLRVCHSNHGSLVYRRALKHGIPVEYIKAYREILFPEGGGDGWSWEEEIQVDGLLIKHEVKGDPLATAAHERANLIIGHEHGKFSTVYRSSNAVTYFASYAGCLIDRASMAFQYGKLHMTRPVLGCLVIDGGLPINVPMQLDKRGRWTGDL